MGHPSSSRAGGFQGSYGLGVEVFRVLAVQGFS